MPAKRLNASTRHLTADARTSHRNHLKFAGDLIVGKGISAIDLKQPTSGAVAVRNAKRNAEGLGYIQAPSTPGGNSGFCSRASSERKPSSGVISPISTACT